MNSPIEHLARKTANAGLKLRDAKALFEALYMADALMLSGGSMEKAAKRSKISRDHFYRMRRLQEQRSTTPAVEE